MRRDHSDKDRLESAINSAYQSIGNASLESSPWLVQIIVIWMSGYLEVVCRNVLRNYITSRAHEDIVNYVNDDLDKFTNPKLSKIYLLFCRFNNVKADVLKKFIEDNEEIKNSIDSVVNLRNQVAHGRDITTTLGQVRPYFEDIKKFARKIEEVFPPKH